MVQNRRIIVEPINTESDPITASVRIDEGDEDGSSSHNITLTRKDFARLARQAESPSDFVVRCFSFLLAREPKESILGRFDVMVIARYFPEFEKEITKKSG